MTVTAQSISLREIASACNSLGTLVNAISDQNSLAMVIGNGGEVMFTKQALRVLSETHHDHPLQKLITNATHQYHQETGEDCKHFLLLLNEMMQGMENLLKNLHEFEVRRLLLRETYFLTAQLPEIFEEIRSSKACITNPITDGLSFSKDLRGIVLSFLDSKFSHCVAKDLSRLVVEFLQSCISHWSCAVNSLHYLISHFNILCSKSLSPITESRILKGFVLNHKLLANSEGEPEEGIHFVVVWNLPGKSENATWKLESLPLQFSHLFVSVKKILSSLKSRGISTVISPDVACDTIQSLCLQEKVLLLSRVEREDIENILFFSGISALSFLSDPLELQNVGHIKGIRSVISERFSYTHLETLLEVRLFTPHHILLCAQLDALWREYYTEIWNCLKAVKQWLSPGRSYFPVVEQLVGVNCGFPKRSAIISNVSPELNHTEDGNSVPKSCDFGVSLPLGLFEASFKKALSNCEEKHSSFPHLYLILNSALLKVICSHLNVSLRDFEGEETYLKFYENKKRYLVTPIEPLSSKEIQVCKILQLIQQLLRVDAVLSSKC